MRGKTSRVAMIGAFASLIMLTASQADARGGFSRSGGASSMSRGGGGGRTNASGFSRGGNYNSGSVNRGVNTGNINTGNVNTGNIHVNTGDINVDVDHDYGCCHGWHDYPNGGLVAGAVIGSAVTAAAIGSRYYVLPAGCVLYPYGGFTYYSCAGTYYKPTYQGDTVVYVVVAKP